MVCHYQAEAAMNHVWEAYMMVDGQERSAGLFTGHEDAVREWVCLVHGVACVRLAARPVRAVTTDLIDLLKAARQASEEAQGRVREEDS